MNCPLCDSPTEIIDSRTPTSTRKETLGPDGPEDGATAEARGGGKALAKLLGTTNLRWRRRRRCVADDCGRRFSTAEIGVPLLRQLVGTAEGTT